MNTITEILEKLRKSGLLIVFGVLSFYFMVNAIKGERGIYQYLYLKKKVQTAEMERAKYHGIKRDLEHKVAMLSEESLDLDYLEERARVVLNMINDGEYVILDKDIDKK